MGRQRSHTPSFSLRPVLEVDGVELHQGLLGFQVEKVPNAPHRCVVVLDAPTLEAQPPERLPTFGQTLTLSMEVPGGGPRDAPRNAPGGGAAPERLFEGRIVGFARLRDQGSAPRIEVEAADALQALAMTRRSRTFPDGTVVGVVRAVAAGHGLAAEVAFPSSQPGAIVQADETDLALLRRLAQQTDGEFWVEDSTLRFLPVGHGEGDAVTLSADADLLEYRIRADLSGQRADVEVRGWDPATKDAIAERPSPGTLWVTPGSLAPGPQVLAESWGRGRPPTEPSVHLGPATPQEARRWAAAWSRSLAASFVELRGSVGPEAPRIRPGLPIELTGAEPRFHGRYRVVACRHLMNLQKGFRTEFRALCWVRHRRGIPNE